MGEQPKKSNICAGLLAHMGAKQTRNTFIASSPVPKPGIFHALRKGIYFRGRKYHHMLRFC